MDCCTPRMHLPSATVVVRDTELVADYELLENKPRINGVELVGDRSLEELGITGSGGTGGTGLPVADDGDVDGLFGGGTGDGPGGDAPGQGGYEVATDEDIDALFGQ